MHTKYETIRGSNRTLVFIKTTHHLIRQHAATLLELDVRAVGRVYHHSYSMYLAPFDFDVCPKVKLQFKGRRFSSLPEFRSASANIISQYNQDWYRAIFNKWVKQHRKCIVYNGEYFGEKWQVIDWRSQFSKPTLLTSLIASLACSTSAVVTVFKAPYVIGKWLNVYHYFSSYRRQIEVFSSVCFINSDPLLTVHVKSTNIDIPYQISWIIRNLDMVFAYFISLKCIRSIRHIFIF